MKAQDLIEKFNYAYSNKWGYIWGQSGAVWTQVAQDAATREQTVKWGSKWIGKHVADCSGLFVWAYKQLGGSIYHGSNTIWSKYTTDKGTLTKGKRTDGQELKPGSAVFMTKGDDRHHIGLYIGDGYVIEAKGTYYGVVRSKITSWNEWAELKGVSYGDAETVEESVATATVIAATGSTVRLRQEPSTNCRMYWLVPIGTEVEVGDEKDGWTAVKWGNRSGWMMSQFLQRG